jgi:hypothetical protein
MRGVPVAVVMSATRSGLAEHGFGHHLVERVGSFEQRPVPGRVEDEHLLGWRVERPEPLVGEDGPAGEFVSSLHEVDGHVELRDVGAEVDVLQLGVEDGEDVQEGWQVMYLLQQRVLLDEEIFGEAASPFVVPTVVVRVAWSASVNAAS